MIGTAKMSDTTEQYDAYMDAALTKASEAAAAGERYGALLSLWDSASPS